MTPGDSTHRNCPQGHTVPDELDRCPVCGDPVADETTEETRGHSLWDVMGQPETTPTDTVDSGQEEAADEKTVADEDLEENGPETEGDPDHGTDEAQRPRGLWDVMQQGDEDEPGDTVPELPETEPVELADATGAPEDNWNEGEAGEDEDEPDPAPAARPRKSSRSCRISLVTGIISILLAGLGLVPPVIWTSVPALMVGLVAVYTGLVGISDTRSSSGRVEAMVGIGLGTLGMFLPRMLQMLL